MHPRTAQALARHSTFALTMEYYTHTTASEEAEAVQVLPNLGEPDADVPALAAAGGSTEPHSVWASCKASEDGQTSTNVDDGGRSTPEGRGPKVPSKSDLSRWRDGKRQGKHRMWYESGQPWNAVTYVDGKRQGLMESYSESGVLIASGHYLDGFKHGPWRTWFPSGALKSRGSYGEQQARIGEWVYWDANGERMGSKSGFYQDDELVRRRVACRVPLGRIGRRITFRRVQC